MNEAFVSARACAKCNIHCAVREGGRKGGGEERERERERECLVSMTRATHQPLSLSPRGRVRLLTINNLARASPCVYIRVHALALCRGAPESSRSNLPLSRTRVKGGARRRRRWWRKRNWWGGRYARDERVFEIKTYLG